MLSRREGGEVLQFALLSGYRHVSLSCEQSVAPIAQLGERQTEDLKVPGSIPGLGMPLVVVHRMMLVQWGGSGLQGLFVPS